MFLPCLTASRSGTKIRFQRLQDNTTWGKLCTFCYVIYLTSKYRHRPFYNKPIPATAATPNIPDAPITLKTLAAPVTAALVCVDLPVAVPELLVVLVELLITVFPGSVDPLVDVEWPVVRDVSTIIGTEDKTEEKVDTGRLAGVVVRVSAEAVETKDVSDEEDEEDEKDTTAVADGSDSVDAADTLPAVAPVAAAEPKPGRKLGVTVAVPV